MTATKARYVSSLGHYGQHPQCEACDRAAGFSGGNRWEATLKPDGAVRVDRIWWERGSCYHSFRADRDGAVYDCQFTPRRIDAGATGYVSRDDRDWAEAVAAVAKRLLASGKAEDVYRDGEPPEPEAQQ